ncbi:MAG TPA: hypothetical protein VI701_04530 [Anaerolineales bacterium]|nr:hypothetical protein [Anaerolineales bacterium]
MESASRDDIRKLLKMFGIRADELIVAHLARTPSAGPLRLALILEDRTDYGKEPPADRLHLELEGDVRRE